MGDQSRGGLIRGSTIILAFLIWGSTEAQILRINKVSLMADSVERVSGYVALDANLNNGNSTAEEQITFTSIRGTADLSYTSEKHVYFIISDARYFKSTGGPLQSTGYTHLRSILLNNNRLSYELFGQAQYDEGRNLNRRLLAGGGLRFRLLEELAIGTGIMQEFELWELPGEEGIFTDRNLTKSTSYISGRVKFSEYVTATITGYYQTGFDRSIDGMRNRVSGDASVDIKIASKFDFNLRYTLSYDERPIIPLSKTVYVLGTGVKYSF
ncbi:MAG: DUF481 domain-containing protein [Flavobacteriales bacterium]|nr:DUF481 domain-containing protein [Flavobacteriales bacterium]